MRTITDSESFRTKVCNKLNEILNDENASLNLEKGIYNYSLKEADRKKIVKKWDNKFFVEIYTSHLRSILNNLNENWINEIREGNIQSHKLAFMTHQELNHEQWDELIKIKSLRDKNKFEANIVASVEKFCYKCKGKKCTFYMQQTRACDEPMTVYYTCCECGNRWKSS